MKKINYFLSIFLLSLLTFHGEVKAQTEEMIKLKVPYTSEVPTGQWIKPWNNACEEASIIMVESYYFGYESMDKKTAIKYMNPLFAIENKIFGYNADTNAAETAKLINDHTSFEAVVKDNPTLEEIKEQLRANHPVITLHYAKNIPNKNYHFRADGSYYHVIVLVGFDDNTKEFIVNDSGDDKTGAFHRYSYDIVMDSLHDFNHKTKKANGIARVIFTKSKVLFKTKNNSAVYLISHDTKYPIANPKVFLDHGWKWKKIRTVSQEMLDKFQTGELISS